MKSFGVTLPVLLGVVLLLGLFKIYVSSELISSVFTGESFDNSIDEFRKILGNIDDIIKKRQLKVEDRREWEKRKEDLQEMLRVEVDDRIDKERADGILLLGDIKRKGDLIRTFQIIKMRGTAHSRTKFAMNISSKNGIELAPLLKSRE